VSASTLIPHKDRQDAFLRERFGVRDIMTEEVQSTKPDTPITELAARMRKGRLGCMPVVDDDHRILGIITEADFVGLALRLLEDPGT
jgi:CBS domain-containing protein